MILEYEKGKFMKLEDLLGEELFAKVNEKLEEVNSKEPDKLKHIRYADLSEGEYVSKGKFDSLNADFTSKQTELDEANKLIEQLKKESKSNEAYKEKFAEYEKTIAQLQEQNYADKLNNAVKMALLASGVSDVDYITYKLNEKLSENNETLELDNNGNVKGIDSRIEELKITFPKMFDNNTVDGLNVLDPKKLPDGNPNAEQEPQSLADALRMHYENLK